MIRSHKTHDRVKLDHSSMKAQERMLAEVTKLVHNKVMVYNQVTLGVVNTPKGLYLCCAGRGGDMRTRLQDDPVSFVGNYSSPVHPENVEGDVLSWIKGYMQMLTD